MADSLYDAEAVKLSVENGMLFVTGAPGFDNAMHLAQAGNKWLEHASLSSISIDVTQVKAVNSGVLCVLLEWLRTARQHHVSVTVVKLPERLRDLVRISGLGSIPEFAETTVS